jgi:MarR family transcriptional regulator, lower aerobic nicotinate degradation pathway regulator
MPLGPRLGPAVEEEDWLCGGVPCLDNVQRDLSEPHLLMPNIRHTNMSIISSVAQSTGRPEFERGTGFLLARLGSLAARSWNAFLAECGLTQTQYTTLMLLAEHGSLGQLRLARLAAVDARNLVAVLDRLADRALIVRETDHQDRRRRNVRLTTSGTAVVHEMASDAARAGERFLGTLSTQQRQQLNALLQQLNHAHTHKPEPDGSRSLASSSCGRSNTRPSS